MNMDLDLDQIPLHMLELCEAYITDREPVEDEFLEAIISNNLRGAVQAADDTNIALIPVYVSYFYNKAPSECWGSKARYEAWLTGE